MLPTELLEYVSLCIPCIVPRTGTIARYFDDEMVEFFEAENAQVAGERHPAPLPGSRPAPLAQGATSRFGRQYSWSRHKRVYTALVADMLVGR